MKIFPTHLLDVKIIEPQRHSDKRGYFVELCRQDVYQRLLGTRPFVQTNFSHSHRHVLRGLHFQTTQPQGKLIQCLQGTVYDVAVDVRPKSPTFGQWVAAELSATNGRQLWIPEGFAHGFVCLTEQADIVYHCTDYYHPESEAILLWNDPTLAIDWPVSHPQLSDKDQQGHTLEEFCR